MVWKIYLSIVFFVFGLSFVFSQPEVVLNPEVRITKLSDRVWVVTHSFPWESNSLVVKASDKELILIDTPYTNEATEQVLQFIGKEIKPTKITVLLTGFHLGCKKLSMKNIEKLMQK